MFVSVGRLWEDIHHAGDWQGAGNLRSNAERPVPCHRGDQWRHAVQRIYVLSGGQHRTFHNWSSDMQFSHVVTRLFEVWLDL